MKKLLLFCTMLFIVHASAQRITKIEQVSDHSTYIKGDSFEGCIFADSYHNRYSNVPKTKAYTPTSDEVALAERILLLDMDTIHFYGHQYFIRKHLKKYLRQYFGYINAAGEKIIYINAFWKKTEFKEKRWLKDQIIMLDGGDYYWQIKINLNNQRSFDFFVNGEA